MTNYLNRHSVTLGRNESGQMAFLMVLTMPVIAMFFALSLDVGVWYFDHRMAQNQADAAALAGVQDLPAADTTEATAAVHKWLEKNGSGPDDLSCLEYSDLHPTTAPDGQFDTLRVCVERQSPGIFSSFAGIFSVDVGAIAKARAALECARLDIVLVIDNSGSIDPSEHVELQTAATTLVDEFCLDDNYGARIGVTRFRGSSAPVHNMSVDATSLKASIDAINQGGSDLASGTNIVFGLDGGAAQYPSGPGDRSNAPNKMIFITDGDDNTGVNSYDDIALASLATGAEVFAIGVGSVTQSTLDAISTDPNATLQAADFAGLILLVGEIVAALSTGEALIE